MRQAGRGAEVRGETGEGQRKGREIGKMKQGEREGEIETWRGGREEG